MASHNVDISVTCNFHNMKYNSDYFQGIIELYPFCNNLCKQNSSKSQESVESLHSSAHSIDKDYKFHILKLNSDDRSTHNMTTVTQ